MCMIGLNSLYDTVLFEHEEGCNDYSAKVTVFNNLTGDDDNKVLVKTVLRVDLYENTEKDSKEEAIKNMVLTFSKIEGD